MTRKSDVSFRKNQEPSGAQLERATTNRRATPLPVHQTTARSLGQQEAGCLTLEFSGR